MEGKKDMLFFPVRLCLFNIRDAHTSVAKGRLIFLLRVFDYATKGRCALLGARLLLAMKEGTPLF
jgi:hypothetical protein